MAKVVGFFVFDDIVNEYGLCRRTAVRLYAYIVKIQIVEIKFFPQQFPTQIVEAHSSASPRKEFQKREILFLVIKSKTLNLCIFEPLYL